MGLGVQELLIVLLIIVVLFGASKLPRLGGAVGESLRNFKRGLRGGDEGPDGDDTAGDGGESKP